MPAEDVQLPDVRMHRFWVATDKKLRSWPQEKSLP